MPSPLWVANRPMVLQTIGDVLAPLLLLVAVFATTFFIEAFHSKQISAVPLRKFGDSEKGRLFKAGQSALPKILNALQYQRKYIEYSIRNFRILGCIRFDIKNHYSHIPIKN